MAPRSAEFWKQYQEAKRIVAQGAQQADLFREEFLDSNPGNADILYDPCQTSNPADPRCRRMRYWRDEQVVQVEWGDGGPAYNYYGVTPQEFRRVLNSKSAGRAVKRILDNHPYGRSD